jgi:hypothetical protein
MAVSASHVAFLDLRQDLWPRFRVREPRDFASFGRRVAMVEVEEHWVILATIDAGMLKKIGE